MVGSVEDWLDDAGIAFGPTADEWGIAADWPANQGTVFLVTPRAPAPGDLSRLDALRRRHNARSRVPGLRGAGARRGRQEAAEVDHRAAPARDAPARSRTRPPQAVMNVFLSASLPDDARGDYRPYDPRRSMPRSGRSRARSCMPRAGIVFGAHPTISPVILLVAGEFGVKGAIDIYQSAYFAGRVPGGDQASGQTRATGIMHEVPHGPVGRAGPEPRADAPRDADRPEHWPRASSSAGWRASAHEYDLLAGVAARRRPARAHGARRRGARAAASADGPDSPSGSRRCSATSTTPSWRARSSTRSR